MSIRVLLIDDDPTLRDVAHSFLTHIARDLTIDPAESADAGLEKLRLLQYDAIVSDFEMPGMNGIELLKKLKSNGGCPPFLLFTGRGREEVAIEALNNGAAFYVQKGGEPKAQFTELLHKIREAVRRDRAERAVQESRQRMADVLNFLPDPTIAINTEGTLIVWNHAAEELTGTPASELLGKGNYAYAVPFYGKERPLLLDLVLHPDEKRLTELYTVTKNAGDLIYAESRITLRNGKTRTLWIKATLLKDTTGTTIGAIETLRDITVRKQLTEERIKIQQNLLRKNEEILLTNARLAEADRHLRQKNEELGEAFEAMAAVEEELRQTVLELQESHRSLREREENFRTLIESLTDAVIVHNGGRILYGNRAAYALFLEEAAAQPLQESLYAHFSPGDAIETASRKVLDEDTTIPHLESRLITESGNTVPLDITLCPTRHHNEPAVLAVIRDVTERCRHEEEIRTQTKRLELQAQALTRANHTISLMNEVTWHDILNQLSALKGYISLGKQHASDDTLRSYMDRQEAVAESIHRHILFTRDYTEIGSRDPEWQDVCEVFSRAARQAGTNRVAISANMHGTRIYADHMLEKVFSNLIDNSLRHGGKVGTIRLSAIGKAGSLLLVYEDDGIGIPPGAKAQIFKRGYGKNTGLGLYLAQEILAITGITISEEGTAGAGVRFIMEIPSGAFRIPAAINDSIAS